MDKAHPTHPAFRLHRSSGPAPLSGLRRSGSAAIILGAGLCAFLAWSDPALSQTSLDACLAAPEAGCTEVIFNELRYSLPAIEDPNQMDRMAQQLAVTLAEGKRFDEANSALYHMMDFWAQPGMREIAALDIVSGLGAQSREFGLGFLHMIEDDEMYDHARSQHIANLVDHGAVDQALRELTTENRTGAPLGLVGLSALALALLERGQTEEALQLVAENMADDPVGRGSLLSRMASDRLQMSQIDMARTILEQIEDPMWRVTTGARIGEALARAGDMEAAEQAFAAARSELAALPDADRRFHAFGAFARSALLVGRYDLAIAAIADVSTYRFDQVEAYNMLARFALSPRINLDVRAPLQAAMDELQAGPRDGDGIPHRYDGALAQLAQTMALSRDVEWAIDTLAQIRDRDRRNLETSDIADSLVAARLLDEAVTVLAAVDDPDEQARSLIFLAHTALRLRRVEIGGMAMAQLLDMVDGPEWVPVTDDTISRLAELESSLGQYGTAETRLRHLDNTDLQLRGRITNLGFAARSGSEEDYATYLEIAEDAVLQIGDPAIRALHMRNLLIQLVYGERFDDALRIAGDVQDPEARDALLTTLASALSGHAGPAVAMDAVDAITDPTARSIRRFMILLSALRQSLDI